MGIASVVRRGNGWLLPVALAIADWSWLWLLMAIVQTWIGEPSDGSPLVGWWICALILIGRGATVATRRMRSHRIRANVVVAAGLALVLLASRRSEERRV